MVVVLLVVDAAVVVVVSNSDDCSEELRTSVNAPSFSGTVSPFLTRLNLSTSKQFCKISVVFARSFSCCRTV